MGVVRAGVGLVLALGLLGLGCGEDSGSGNNDQGIVFRAVGIFQGELREGMCELPVIDNAVADQGFVVALDDPALDGGFPASVNDQAVLGFCRGFLELQNNLFGQAINVERIDLEYEVPGARIPIPPNSVPVGFRINPADSEEPNSFGLPNVIFTQLVGQIVPSSLVFFLRQNRLSLPELPYVMIVHITAVGRSDDGVVRVSNEVRYTVEFIPL